MLIEKCKDFERKQEVQNVRNQTLYLLIERGCEGGLSVVPGPRCLKSRQETERTDVDADDYNALPITQH